MPDRELACSLSSGVVIRENDVRLASSGVVCQENGARLASSGVGMLGKDARLPPSGVVDREKGAKLPSSGVVDRENGAKLQSSGVVARLNVPRLQVLMLKLASVGQSATISNRRMEMACFDGWTLFGKAPPVIGTSGANARLPWTSLDVGHDSLRSSFREWAKRQTLLLHLPVELRSGQSFVQLRSGCTRNSLAEWANMHLLPAMQAPLCWNLQSCVFSQRETRAEAGMAAAETRGTAGTGAFLWRA
mmetsp:Transcript_17330/g.55470  ORF Transcript_17330/g.55470 Transcript_17330/m.55470 type:complete len:247 (+) Transcript_17330:585-1325(+)